MVTEHAGAFLVLYTLIELEIGLLHVECGVMLSELWQINYISYIVNSYMVMRNQILQHKLFVQSNMASPNHLSRTIPFFSVALVIRAFCNRIVPCALSFTSQINSGNSSNCSGIKKEGRTLFAFCLATNSALRSLLQLRRCRRC